MAAEPQDQPVAAVPAKAAATDDAPATTASESVPQPSEGTEDILPAGHWNMPVHEDDDADSTLGSDAASSTASITSSILNYRTINGRTYHADRGNANYWAANDEQALESMDLYAHLCFLLTGKKLYKAPLDASSLKKAVDIGTGTGVWAMDFADEFPECDIIGTDISPIQPGWVPPNLKFEIEDCTQEWTFAPNTFDYVHMRLLYGSISKWDELFDQAYKVTAPGGWIESMEASPVAFCDDGTVTKASPIDQWGLFYLEGGDKIDRSFRVLEQDTQLKNMQRLGLQEIGFKDIKCPCGSWPKDPDMLEIGRVCQATLEQDYEGYLGVMAEIARGWTKEETAVYCAHVRAAFRNPRNHAYFKFRIVWGRKPLDA